MRPITGVMALDAILVCDDKKGEVITLYGGESTFKTGLCLNAVKKYREKTKNSLYFTLLAKHHHLLWSKIKHMI